MRVSQWFESGWPAIPIIMLAAAAYGQARGLTQLVAAELTDGLRRSRAAPRTTPGPDVPANATPILERNVFDSETGALTGVEAELPPPPPPPPNSEPKISTVPCDFGQVTSIVASGPNYSFASIKTAAGKTEIYDVGDAVGSSTIHRIGWDRVWLGNDSSGCVMKLGDKVFKPKRKRAPKRRAKRRRRSATRVPKEISDKIQKLGPGEFTIERSAFEEVLKRQTELMRRTRIRPVKENGKVVGLRVSVRKGTLLETLGLKSGDVISSINGFQLTNPQKALEAYGRLMSADNLTLSFERKGKPETIRYRIQ